VAVQKYSDSSSLAEIIERILDKGIVIFAHVSVALLGITLLTINSVVVISSIESYCLYHEAMNMSHDNYRSNSRDNSQDNSRDKSWDHDTWNDESWKDESWGKPCNNHPAYGW